MNRAKPPVTTMLLLRRARALDRHLPEAASGSDHGLHQARVATRRLREAVPVLTSGVKGTKAAKARRKIRRLTRALGTVRELDVVLHVLDEFAQTQRVPRPALEEVRLHVIAERDRRRAVMLQRLHKVDPVRLTRRLANVAEALRQSNGQGWRKALAERLVKRADNLRAAMGEAGQIFAPDRLHQVRIAAKKLRYALEIAAESGTRTARRLVTTLKRTQDTLGRLHDLQVLLTHVAAVQTDAAGRRAMPNEGLERLARVLEEECRHLHGRYLSAVPALTEVCELTRASIVPELARPRRTRPPIKMTLGTATVRRRAAGAAR
jgi:CHAD domain-containing protein